MECLTSPELTLGEWGKGLNERLHGQRFPFGATFEITERCNLGCVHCFINQPAQSRIAKKQELSLAEITRIMDQMADAGVINLLLTGGEIFLRQDFKEIYLHAKRVGMLVMLFTNGTLLTPELADFLAEWPPYFIEISLYGRTRETYEKITRVSGSFDRCMQGIQLALDRELKLGLKTVVLTVNQHELKAIKTFSEEIDVPFRYDAMLWPCKNGDIKPWSYQLSPQEIVDLDKKDENRYGQQKEMYSIIAKDYSRSENVFSCGAGFSGFHVDALGKMSVCMMVRKPAYDLRSGNVEEGWQFLGEVRAKKRELDTPCRTCDVGMLCIQCPGWSQMVHGDLETPVDYICEVGHLRKEFIISLKG